MEVLEDEDERPPLGHCLEEQAPRSEGLSAAVVAELALCAEAYKREQVRLHPRCVRRLGKHLVDGTADLLRGLARRILLMDPRLGLDDLAECPQRHPVPIRETAALTPRDELGIVLHELAELVDKATLADAGHADERHELGRSRAAHAGERVAEDGELVLAADELRARPVLDIDPGACPHLVGQPHGDGLGLPLRLDRGRLAELDRVSRSPVRRVVDENAVDRRRALQAGCGVDDIS